MENKRLMRKMGIDNSTIESIETFSLLSKHFDIEDEMRQFYKATNNTLVIRLNHDEALNKTCAHCTKAPNFKVSGSNTLLCWKHSNMFIRQK